jgi:thiamine-monophosphate kinase
MDLTVQDIGEQGLLARLQTYCPPDLIGDDAAILSPSPQRSLVVSTDVLVQEVHFSDRTMGPEDVGWRAAAANLSDLAAMGADPLGITVGLGLPGHTPVAWVEAFYRGLRNCLDPWQTPILGGDCVRSPVISIAITVLGEVSPERVIRRSTAQVNDAIVVTGYHGASRAGLELLLHPEKRQGLSPEAQNWLIKTHQRPQPRLDLLPWLKSLPHPVRIAGMDSSDGLADAILQICRASGVGAEIDLERLSMPPSFGPWLAENEALDWTLYGGEDFELVLCLELSLAQQLVQQIGPPSAIIGTIQKTPEVYLKGANTPPQILSLQQGFQHFSR